MSLAEPLRSSSDQQGPEPAVSPNNPCPFLRALVAGGYVPGHIEALGSLSHTIVTASDDRPSDPPVSGALAYVIAMVANGLGPGRILENIQHGVQLDGLRGGPLDKRGAGSRILDVLARIDETELARLDDFASDKVDAAGVVERGLGSEQIKTMMDANFARAAGHRRAIDRILMTGEWPVLLKVIGKPSAEGRYLSLAEVRTLFVDRRLPDRIVARLQAMKPA